MRLRQVSPADLEWLAGLVGRLSWRPVAVDQEGLLGLEVAHPLLPSP